QGFGLLLTFGPSRFGPSDFSLNLRRSRMFVESTSSYPIGRYPDRSRFSGGGKDLARRVAARVQESSHARSLTRLNCAGFRDDASEKGRQTSELSTKWNERDKPSPQVLSFCGGDSVGEPKLREL